MYTEAELAEYLEEIREQVCCHCIEKPPGGPPCAPLGKPCGIELHLAEIVELTHAAHSEAMDPYIDLLHDDVCANCANRPTAHCPCPLEYLLQLAVQAIEVVDAQKQAVAH